MVEDTILDGRVGVTTCPGADVYGRSIGIETEHRYFVHDGSLKACTTSLHGREGLGHFGRNDIVHIIGLEHHLQTMTVLQTTAEEHVLLKVHLVVVGRACSPFIVEACHVAFHLLVVVCCGSAYSLHLHLHG